MSSTLYTRASDAGITNDTAWRMPGYDAEAVDLTSADYVPACGFARRLWIGGGTGAKVRLQTLAGNDVIFQGVNAGTMLEIGFKKIYKDATNTTATLMVAIG